MATYDKLPSGKTRVRYRQDGQRYTRTFPSKKAAERFIRQLETEPETVHATLRFGNWVASWYPTHTPLVKQSSVETYRRAFNNHILPQLGHLALHEITARTLRDWQAGLLSSGYSPATVKQARTSLGLALKAAVVDGHLDGNPLDQVPPIRAQQKEIRILSDDELHALAEGIDPRWRALVLMGGYCGLRIGEALALSPTDIDLNGSRVHVRRTLTVVKDNEIVIGPPKTRASTRVIALPGPLRLELHEHLDAGFANDEFLFTTVRGRRMNPANFRNRDWSKATKAVGLEGIRFHDLRHTAVSMWLRMGASPKLVARRAGHGSVAYVIDTYGHLLDNEDGDLADKLGEDWVVTRI